MSAEPITAAGAPGVTDRAWVDLLRDGDLVVAAQGVGEPTALLEALAGAADLPDVELFVGLSHTRVLDAPPAVPLLSFGAMGPLARHAAGGRASVIPCHFVDVPRVLRRRAPGRHVVLVQVSPPDAQGRHSLGVSVDYTHELVETARLVVAEVNEQMPVTDGPRLSSSAFAAVVRTSRPLPRPAEATPREEHRALAAHAATLVPDGATIQLGVGALPSVLAGALTARRDLKVRSTLVGDWLLTLARAGSLADVPGAVVLSEAAGSAELHAHVAASGASVRSVDEVNRPDEIGRLEAFVALNSALQVDLTGQVNAEEIASGYVGGIAGQPDFLRAAQRTPAGASVVLLPATTRDGSRIVRALHAGTVTTPRASVDAVVTEFGVADLRGRSLTERAEALIAVAAPEHRDELRRRDAPREGP